LLCSYRARSRTSCVRVTGKTESGGCCVAIRQDDVLSVGGRWERRNQQVVLQLSSKITHFLYFLWAGDGRDGVSRLFSSYRTRSHTNCVRAMGETESAGCCRARSCTFCGREMGETESAGCSAAIAQDHVHSVGGRWERRSQQIVLQL